MLYSRKRTYQNRYNKRATTLLSYLLEKTSYTLWIKEHVEEIFELATKLIKSGADVNVSVAINNVGPIITINPLAFGATYNNYDFVKMLIQKGANVNVQDNLGYTPLMRCFTNGANKEIANLLIENGADVNLKNCDGFTVFDMAKNFKAENILTQTKEFLN